jgi:hypothetical protein
VCIGDAERDVAGATVLSGKGEATIAYPRRTTTLSGYP